MAEDTAVEDGTATEAETTTEPVEDEPLGPAGVKALAAMKEQLKSARAEAKAGKDAAKRLADLEASSMSEQEKAVATARKEAADQVRSEVLKDRIADKIEAAMAGRFAVPAELLRLNHDEFVVDGQIDTAAIKTAVDGLLTQYPNLAAGTPPRFQGSGDQGPRSGSEQTITQRIAEAEKTDPRLARSLKAQQLSELPH